MFDSARSSHAIIGFGFVLVVAFFLLTCFHATPALAVNRTGLFIGTLEDSDGPGASADVAATTDSQTSSPKVITKKFTMRVYQEATINVESATFKSSNKKVATVSKNGLVKARKKGEATITATTSSVTYIFRLTVKKSNFKPVPLKKLKRNSYFRKYMSETQLKKAYKKALKLVRPLGDLKKKDQIMGVAVRLRELFENGITYSMSSKHYDDPYGYFIKKKASCAGCARATGLCLNILGYNYEHVNENQYSHQWARVKVGKKYWICDAYGLYCGPEPSKRKHPYL